MTKFRSLVGDAIRFHDTTHGALKAAVRLATRDDDGMGMTDDDWSPEARAAALEARKKHGHKTGQELRGEYNKHAAAGNHKEAASVRSEQQRRADPNLQASFSPRKPGEEHVPSGNGKSIPRSKVNKVTKSLLGW